MGARVCLGAWVTIASVSIASAQAGDDAAEGEWRAYGADKAGSKYSPLEQINKDNFTDLEIAWRWQSVDGFLSKTTAMTVTWRPVDRFIDCGLLRYHQVDHA